MKALFTLLSALMLASTLPVNADDRMPAQTTPEQTQQQRVQDIDPDSVENSCDGDHDIFADLLVYIDDDLYPDPTCAKT